MSANRKAYILGLTGGIASGKSEAAKHLSSLGAACIDADAISRAMTAPGGPLLPALREAFGDGIFDEDGSLNRRALADIVFADPMQRRLLDSVTHPAIQKAMMDDVERYEDEGKPLVVLNVPLLFETGMDALCDETWLISLDRDKQIERLMERDGLTHEQAVARIDSQMSLEDKEALATVIIDNRRSIEKLKSELTGLYTSLEKKLHKLENE
ncbi:MAG: dephospho-CoA kinase [Clostridia bacterium]|nr:dephospho-CoA kinase [Clostridia bacterium]MBQ5769691.1 dephospho-CoA kinase [Clostridia bacterium]